MAIRHLRAYPYAVRPLAVWGWDQSVRPDHVEHGLERLIHLGFGGVVVAPRELSDSSFFLSPLWMESLEATERAARRLGIEMWAEAPLKNFDRTNLLPLSDLGQQIHLGRAPANNPSQILASYRKDASGRMRRVEQDHPANAFLYASRMDAPDFFEPAVAARYIARILEPHRMLFPAEIRMSAFRGFFFGSPRPLTGELWNENLATLLEEEGFVDLFGRVPDLFGEPSGGEPAFLHHYRRAVAKLVQAKFAKTLVEWAVGQQVSLVGPAAQSWDDSFPAWAFENASMLRMIQAPGNSDASGMERLVSDRPGLVPMIRVSSDCLSSGDRNASAISQAAEYALSCTGGRAVLDWIPVLEDSALKWNEDTPSFSLQLPGLRGLREMNKRFSGWTLIGSSAVRSPRILVIAPLTSYWRLPHLAGTPETFPDRPHSSEHLRLQRLQARVENCLRALSFDFATWHECSDLPEGLSPHLANPAYSLVILPGLLNLNHETWSALETYALSGGKILSMERHPAFVDGVASEELTQWAKSAVERCETIDHLSAWLEDHVRRPARAISLSRGLEPRAPEVFTFEENNQCAWLIARNPSDGSSVRGLIEATCPQDEFIDEVDLETGTLNAAPSVVRLENVVSLEIDLAPGQSRIFKLQKAPLAEVESIIESPPQFANIIVGADWHVKPSDQNLFPLTSMEFSLDGQTWHGPEHASHLHQAVNDQRSLSGVDASSPVHLKISFEIEQGPVTGLSDILDLQLYFQPRTILRHMSLNGTAADLQATTTCSRTGLRKVPLPRPARLGINELVMQVHLAERGESETLPWILGGRFGVVPSHSYVQDERGIVHALGGFRLLACCGAPERLTDMISFESSLVEGIMQFLDSSAESQHDRAWIDWTNWPLLRERSALHEIGMPFYGGMIKLEGNLTIPSPGSVVGPWRTVIFDLGPTRASWAALKVNNLPAGNLGLPPFRRDITSLLDPSGRNFISLRAWFSWSEALAPFIRHSERPSPELTIQQRGFLAQPQIVLLG